VVRHLYGCGRREWYQTTSLVVVCILAKAIEEEENLKVQFSEHIVCSKFYLPPNLDFVSPIVWLYVSWAFNDLYMFLGVIYELEGHIRCWML